jgi:hypothetical protein
MKSINVRGVLAFVLITTSVLCFGETHKPFKIPPLRFLLAKRTEVRDFLERLSAADFVLAETRAARYDRFVEQVPVRWLLAFLEDRPEFGPQIAFTILRILEPQQFPQKTVEDFIATHTSAQTSQAADVLSWFLQQPQSFAAGKTELPSQFVSSRLRLNSENPPQIEVQVTISDQWDWGLLGLKTALPQRPWDGLPMFLSVDGFIEKTIVVNEWGYGSTRFSLAIKDLDQLYIDIWAGRRSGDRVLVSSYRPLHVAECLHLLKTSEAL